MADGESAYRPASDQRSVFATTQWSVVLLASNSSPAGRQALEGLCAAYWYPLYAFLRRQGRPPHDAEDLTQGFFSQLLARDSLSQFRGDSKFRSFLLGALKNFLASEWNHNHRLKRGGGVAMLSLDEERGESRYKLEPVDDMTPEKLFARRWALTVLELAFEKLRAECRAAGKEQLFEEVKSTLTADGTTAPYSQIGRKLQMSEGSIKLVVHRLRTRYRKLLLDEIRQTVASEHDVNEEIRELFAVLRA